MKTDLKKTRKAYFTAKKAVEILDFEAMQYIAISGQGDPNGPRFSQHVSALYQLAYHIKGLYKTKAEDFTVSKLEGFWWLEDEKNYLEVPRSEWHYQIVIMMPDFVNLKALEAYKQEAVDKKDNPLIQAVEVYQTQARKVMQLMHIGPYSDEPENLKILHGAIESAGYEIRGRHHEVYLSDPRKTAPEKMKTILRYEVSQASL